jgi:hypothetical protein
MWKINKYYWGRCAFLSCKHRQWHVTQTGPLPRKNPVNGKLSRISEDLHRKPQRIGYFNGAGAEDF